VRTDDQERSERLRTVDLLSQLDRVALARLAGYMVPLAFAAGEVICSEGDPADGLYIVVRGTLGVYATAAGGERRVNAIGPGHYVGELALLVDQPRSATIRADTEGEILRLDRDQFLQLLGQDPAAAKAVATTLARRLRRRDMESPTDELEAASAPRQVVAGRIARPPAAKVVGLVLALAFGLIAFSPLIDLAQQRFVLLLLAAVALWVTEPVPNVVVSLGLVAVWIVSKLTYDFATLTGFASMNWVFVISVLGIAAMVSRSGLLLRMGLLLIERVLPSGLPAQTILGILFILFVVFAREGIAGVLRKAVRA